jgi:tetratricopeptide (TPR) repeat protein
MNAGRIEAAYKILTVAVRDRAPSADVLALHARACVATWRTAEALASAERAVAEAPESAEAHLALARVHEARRRHLAAIREAREAIALAPSDARAHMALGEFLSGGGLVGTADPEGAADAFREALRLDAQSIRARWGLAKALVALGRSAEAALEVDAVLERAPGYAGAYLLRGTIRMRARDLAAAEEDFRASVTLDASNPTAHFNLARVLQLARRTEEADAFRESYGHARTRAARIEPAEISFREDSGNVRVGLLLAQLCLESRRAEKAWRVSLAVCSSAPPGLLPRAHLFRAEAALAAGRIEDGLASAILACDLLPGDAHPRVLASRLAEFSGDTEAALKYAREAVAADQSSAEAALLLGDALLAGEDPAGALSAYRQAGRLVPGDPRVMAGEGRALAQLGRHSEAEQHLSAALRIRPRNFRWRVHRGEVRLDAGNLRWAEDDLRKAAESLPGFAPAHRALERVLREGGEAAAADSAARRASELEHRVGKIEEGRAAFLKSPGDEAAAQTLATLMEESGRPAEALRVLSQSLEAGGRMP